MKKLIVLIGLLATSALGQVTNNNPTLWDYLTTGSNYFAIPFTTWSVKDHSFGGGLAIGYRATEIVAPVLRLDYFNNRFYSVSLTANLQPPRSLLGKIPVIPFGIAGLATPISGAGAENGAVVTVLGAGAYMNFSDLGAKGFLGHSFIVADYEKWVGMVAKQEDQVRIGFGIKF